MTNPQGGISHCASIYVMRGLPLNAIKSASHELVAIGLRASSYGIQSCFNPAWEEGGSHVGVVA